MHFWNVVLSYVRKDNVQSRVLETSTDIELGERLAPNSKHTIIYNPKENKHSQKSRAVTKENPRPHRQKQTNPRTSQPQRAHGTNSTHYYQTPADQRNYHLL